MALISTLSTLVFTRDMFKIAYSVRPYSIYQAHPPYREILDREGRGWIERIKNDFHATGVLLTIDWSLFDDPANPQAITTRQLVKTLDLIQKNNLDLYVAVNLASLPAYLVEKLSEEHFQLMYNQKVAIIPLNTPLLNFANLESQKLMLDYYRNILKLLSNYSNIIEVIPNFTWHAETEYPHQMQTGYSKPMQIAFQNYLKEKYNNDIRLLNAFWRKGNQLYAYQRFDEIVPDPSWGDPHNTYLPFDAFNNAYGRIDWINFKTVTLKNIVDLFIKINHEFGYPMPVQIGCTFDALIERRGWLDITTLLENCDGIRVGDIAEREESFEFHANYLRSLKEYWEWRRKREGKEPAYPFVIATVSNWPGYSNLSPEHLTRAWIRQLKAFYRQGADVHFVHGWYSPEDPNVLLDSYQPYKAWIDTLRYYKNQPVQKPPFNRTEAVYFSTARAAITHGYNPETISEVEHFESLLPFDKDYQVITDFMVEHDLQYLERFSKLFFTANSHIMADSILTRLLSPSLQAEYVLTTYEAAKKKFFRVPGFLDQTGRLRQDYKVNFIWRTRPDLMRLFPKGNKADVAEAQKIGWPLNQDFIDWCVLYGNREYENFNISYRNWNSLAALTWDSRLDLQKRFPDGYHANDNSGQTLLDILLLDKENKGMSSWPYIDAR